MNVIFATTQGCSNSNPINIEVLEAPVFPFTIGATCNDPYFGLSLTAIGTPDQGTLTIIKGTWSRPLTVSGGYAEWNFFDATDPNANTNPANGQYTLKYQTQGCASYHEFSIYGSGSINADQNVENTMFLYKTVGLNGHRMTMAPATKVYCRGASTYNLSTQGGMVNGDCCTAK